MRLQMTLTVKVGGDHRGQGIKVWILVVIPKKNKIGFIWIYGVSFEQISIRQ